ncbi:hypothetical protein K466DRAFT_591327 [Polyporus arcularius HHB13444]|uniref:Uncharacterized protein n=1 Tax=Polyporus arcularius HHB13444 TaxID=1314778 RepID=A0A5C3NV20_9APHY|nr:hypothetical protein K466DRAFT_591327 [Polyporus arcularius HHB13444]
MVPSPLILLVAFVTALVGTTTGSGLSATGGSKDPGCPNGTRYCSDEASRESCGSGGCACVPPYPGSVYGFCVNPVCLIDCVTSDDCCEKFSCNSGRCVLAPANYPRN